jgi:hypothetical protein
MDADRQLDFLRSLRIRFLGDRVLQQVAAEAFGEGQEQRLFTPMVEAIPARLHGRPRVRGNVVQCAQVAEFNRTRSCRRLTG